MPGALPVNALWSSSVEGRGEAAGVTRLDLCRVGLPGPEAPSGQAVDYAARGDHVVQIPAPALAVEVVDADAVAAGARMDDPAVPGVDGDVVDAVAARGEGQEVAGLEDSQIQRQRPSGPRLVLRHPGKVDPVSGEDILDEARAVEAFARRAA